MLHKIKKVIGPLYSYCDSLALNDEEYFGQVLISGLFKLLLLRFLWTFDPVMEG